MGTVIGAERTPPKGAIILAGGDGTRREAIDSTPANHDVPTQFCGLTSDETMLEQTRRRVAISIPRLRTLTVVNRKHEAYYAPLSASIPTRNLVVQPSNCGTAAAILYGLLRMAAHEQVTSVAIFPSDHYLSDERQFMRHVNSAFATVEVRPELAVILGMAALRPECGYGWIEPGERIGAGETELRAVRRFVEKPAYDDAVELMRRGALWNSLVIVARVSTLLGSIMIALPELYGAFASIRTAIGTTAEQAAIEGVYATISGASFTDSVLAASAVNLAVLPVSGVAFSDLGEPARALDDVRRTPASPKYAVA